jgi:hypothetical protein
VQLELESIQISVPNAIIRNGRLAGRAFSSTSSRDCLGGHRQTDDRNKGSRCTRLASPVRPRLRSDGRLLTEFIKFDETVSTN